MDRSGIKNAADELIPTRQSLLSRLKDWQDQESWRLFFDTYWKLIYMAATRAGLSDAEAQDVVQDTILAVSRNIPKFQYDSEKGSFKGWLLNLTRWRIIDHLRKRPKGPKVSTDHTSTSTGTSAMDRIVDPSPQPSEAAWDEEWEMNLIEAAMRRVKRKVDPTHFQVFDLYVLREWPVSRVAKALKVGPARIYMIKHRINNLIKAEVSYLQKKPI
jgi:RNA polymerase sigma-70 factor (ECF subfamily)